jgi:endonuclease/exonuclease/phosphatase family metal-dependent hydrolase
LSHFGRGIVPRAATLAAIAVLAAVAIAGEVSAKAPASDRATRSPAAAPGVSPGGRIVVVTANLQEAFGAESRHNSEMNVFVPRLLDQVPSRPDVLLLQDSRKKAVDKVAQLLTKQTGDRYVVGQKLRKEPWQKLPHKVWYSTETAIVVNSATMKIFGTRDWVRIRNPWGHPKKNYVEHKGQAYLGVEERDGGARVGVMGVHLPKGPEKSQKVADKFAPWVDRLATFMERKYPNMPRIIGGDFNQTKCIGKEPCEYSPFWKTLESSQFGYTESIWKIQEAKNWKYRIPLAVDWIFSTADEVVDADGDVKNPPKFYSNHRFFWADLKIGPIPTHLTVSASQRAGSLVASGGLDPSLDGKTIKSTLQELQGTTWSDLSTQDAQTSNGSYENVFSSHPSTGTCRLHSAFAGTTDHGPSSATSSKFDCSGAGLPGS